jgi:hypothetical protein
MLFLRSTNNSEKDLEGGYSYHQSDYKVGTIDWLEDGQTEKEFVANAFGCEEDDIEVAEDGYYVQVLEGLCGYALESDNLEDAIEEIDDMIFDKMESINPDNIYIFEGKEIASDSVIEGTLFRPTKVLAKYEN